MRGPGSVWISDCQSSDSIDKSWAAMDFNGKPTDAEQMEIAGLLLLGGRLN